MATLRDIYYTGRRPNTNMPGIGGSGVTKPKTNMPMQNEPISGGPTRIGGGSLARPYGTGGGMSSPVQSGGGAVGGWSGGGGVSSSPWGGAGYGGGGWGTNMPTPGGGGMARREPQPISRQPRAPRNPWNIA